MTRAVVAFPTIMLTTTGARSGMSRAAPLAAIPVGDDLAIIGTSGGSGKTPGWVFNLRARADATLSYKAKVVHVVAKEASRPEYEEAFATAVEIYPGFADYRDRKESSVAVFILRARANGHKGES